jgi:hypothetical protein
MTPLNVGFLIYPSSANDSLEVSVILACDVASFDDGIPTFWDKIMISKRRERIIDSRGIIPQKKGYLTYNVATT